MGEGNGKSKWGDSTGKSDCCEIDGNSTIGEDSASSGSIDVSSGAAFVARKKSADTRIGAVREKRAMVEVISDSVVRRGS